MGEEEGIWPRVKWPLPSAGEHLPSEGEMERAAGGLFADSTCEVPVSPRLLPMLHAIQLQARRTQQERTELHGHRGDNCHVQSLNPLQGFPVSLPGMFSCLWDSIMAAALGCCGLTHGF